MRAQHDRQFFETGAKRIRTLPETMELLDPANFNSAINYEHPEMVSGSAKDIRMMLRMERLHL